MLCRARIVFAKGVTFQEPGHPHGPFQESEEKDGDNTLNALQVLAFLGEMSYAKPV